MRLPDDLQHWILDRRPLALRYVDDREPRIVHPHALYRAKGGELRLCALHVGGAMPLGTLPAWQDYAVERVADVEPVPGRFPVAPDFDPQDGRFAHGVVAVVLP